MPKIIAHRGLSKEAPENTLRGVQAALTLGVDYVEFDVRLTKDSVPVVIHDATVSRTAKIKDGPHVHELTLHQLKQIDVGHQFGKEPIPTLEEVLSLSWGKTGAMIEIKHCPQPNAVVVESIFQVLNKQKVLPKILMGSFSLPLFKLMQKQLLAEKLKIEPIGIVEKPEKIERFVQTGIKHLALWYKIITPSLIDFLKDEDIEAWTFTVNDLEIANFLASIHVNGFISNVPRIFI